MSIPHGLLGKAYAATILATAAIIVTLIGAYIVAGPFWVIAGIALLSIVVLAVWLVWICARPSKQVGG